MKPFVRPALIFLLVVMVPMPAWPIILEMKDGTTVKGHLVSATRTQVTIRLDGTKTTKSYSKIKIRQIVQPVDPERLARLTPRRLSRYYDYANELRIQRRDPEARDTALRLFLICAYLNPKDYGETVFRRMEDLARNPQEARAFRAIAYAFSKGEDAKLLQKLPDPNNDEETLENYVKALRYLRRGKGKQALDYAKKAGVSQAFAKYSSLMTYGRFQELCKSCTECGCVTGRRKCAFCKGKGLPTCPDCKGKGWHICKECKGHPRRTTLTAKLRRRILEIELSHAAAQTGKAVKKDMRKAPWSTIIGSGELRPTPVLSVRCVTEFDPAKSIYKGGKWVKPSK